MGPRMSYAIVFVGGGLGAALRHGVNVLALRWGAAGFPWGTLTGQRARFLSDRRRGRLACLPRGSVAVGWKLFAVTGFLGGFTTFSAFSLDAVNLFDRAGLLAAAAYVAASVGVGIARAARRARTGAHVMQVSQRTVGADEDGMRVDRWFKLHFPGLGFGAHCRNFCVPARSG